MWDKFILGTSEQTTKIFKTGFTKIGHTAVFKPQSFFCHNHFHFFISSKKIDCAKFEKQGTFSISLVGLSPEPPITTPKTYKIFPKMHRARSFLVKNNFNGYFQRNKELSWSESSSKNSVNFVFS